MRRVEISLSMVSKDKGKELLNKPMFILQKMLEAMAGFKI
jgi:hypothetical protein